MMVLPDGIWTPRGNARTAKDSAKAAKLVLLGTGGDRQKSNRGCTKTVCTYKAPFTKESQGTVHLDVLKCQWLRTTESKHNL